MNFCLDPKGEIYLDVVLVLRVCSTMALLQEGMKEGEGERGGEASKGWFLFQREK